MRAWGVAGWTESRWAGLLLGVAERARAGKDPQPWWLPRRLLTVVSADVDDAAGVAAIWILSRPGSSRMREHTELLERLDERWRHAGGGSGSGEDPVEVDVLDVCNGAGVLSLTRGLDPPRSLAAAPWIGCVKIHLGRDVRQVLVGTRLKEVPEQRSLVAVWTAPRSSRGERPVVVALGQDGAELSRMGARDALDTHTWARLREEL